MSRTLLLLVALLGCDGALQQSFTSKGAGGSCKFAAPATAVSCGENLHCLVCTADGVCRWIGFRDCR